MASRAERSNTQSGEASSPNELPSSLRPIATAALAWLAGSAPAPLHADPQSLTVTHAWTESRMEVPADAPLYMTITNAGDSDDQLLRVHCPVANFTEKRTIDQGEGAPASREIKSIPIAAHGTVVLTANTFHVMLLKTTQKLESGTRFTCSAAFKNAGKIDIEVSVEPRSNS
ncbi:copper chaperone PCu(A)C [Methylocella tundrae]|nr:copper chaperone PCu(A)C [Methylocella tundrae]